MLFFGSNGADAQQQSPAVAILTRQFIVESNDDSACATAAVKQSAVETACRESLITVQSRFANA